MDLPSNLWKSPVIINRLLLEAGFECNHGAPNKQHYWVLAPHAESKDGVHLMRNFLPSLSDAEPHMMQQEFAKNVQRQLMKEVAFDGLWLVGFTHPPTTYGVITDTENCWNRMICIWHDEDGDPQYTLESDLPFVTQISHGVEYYVGLANQSHEQWKEGYHIDVLKKEMNLDDDDVSKAVLESLK